MNNSEAEMWRINIENDADMVCSMYGSELPSPSSVAIVRRASTISALHVTRRSSATSS